MFPEISNFKTHRENSGPDGLTGEFFWTFKEKTCTNSFRKQTFYYPPPQQIYYVTQLMHL